MKEQFTCCICGSLCEGYGNNPDGAMWKDETGKIIEPKFSKNARCCDDCNARYVIPGRLLQIARKNK